MTYVCVTCKLISEYYISDYDLEHALCDVTCKILYEHSTPSVDRDTSNHGHHSDSVSSVWMFFTVSISLYTHTA